MDIYGQIKRKEPIAKGWSGDQKYCVTAEDGTKYLLRISPLEQYERKKNEFERMQCAAALGIPMCLPVEFGTCKEGIYSLQSWIDGADAEKIVPTLSDTEQYVYGLEAGRILRQIHSVPVPKPQEDWEIRFNRKLDRKIKTYEACPIKYESGQAFIDYINTNRNLLKDRPQCYQHGDYHIGNMMIDRNGKLQIIDFDRSDVGDPWEEFNRIVWCAQKTPLFASGLVNGYFNGEVPLKFWQLFALYISSNTLSSAAWAIPFGQREIDTMLKQAKDVLLWYDNMRTLVPTWYFKGYYLQSVDGIPYKLKASFDFSFLSKYGRVFKVLDRQDSGNICFGLEKDGARYFVKFAGAPTEQYDGNPKDAISRLKAAVPVYQTLRHPNLIEFITAEDIQNGFACVFKWADGECMGRMWGSSRFMSPEEFEHGATLDEITNVYTIGALAFALFSDYSRTREAWTLRDELYQIAFKAVSDDRNKRQQSIRQFIEEWEANMGGSGQAPTCFCGHDCSRCLTYLATVNNSDELRRQSQQFYKDTFGHDIPLAEIHCLGGRSDDIFYLCRDCPWRKCAKEKRLSACSDCSEYPCKPLAEYQARWVNKCNQMGGTNR